MRRSSSYRAISVRHFAPPLPPPRFRARKEEDEVSLTKRPIHTHTPISSSRLPLSLLGIYEPRWYEIYTAWIIIATLSTSVVGFISWLSLRRKIKRKILLMKQERRRSRRSSEMSSRENAGAFKG